VTEPALLVEVGRGGLIESRHLGSAVVSGLGGVVWSAGDIDAPVLPRSAIKPIQALPLIETGAAERFGLTDRHIALACASHGGEPEHVSLVSSWLYLVGLDATALACGASWPMTQTAMLDVVRAGGAPSALHDNCSGKHAGMLCTAVHCGEEVTGYETFDHPVQQRWIETLAEVSELDLSGAPRAIDGCGIPTLAMTLAALSRAFARMAGDGAFHGVRAGAIRRVRAAMAAQPFLVAGSGRTCTRIMEASAGRVLVKVGAEGVYAGMIPEAGLGFALKIEDGAGRAAAIAVVALVRRVLGPAHELTAALAPLSEAPVETRRGALVGAIRPAGPLAE
jgi:L-asparaginase II